MYTKDYFRFVIYSYLSRTWLVSKFDLSLSTGKDKHYPHYFFLKNLQIVPTEIARVLKLDLSLTAKPIKTEHIGKYYNQHLFYLSLSLRLLFLVSKANFHMRSSQVYNVKS